MLTALASVFVMIVATLASRPLLQLLNTPDSIIDWCTSYLRILFPVSYTHLDVYKRQEYNGGTHMPFEDMALYRALPTATVFDIADAIELKFVMKKAVRMKGVKYIRRCV